MHEFLLGQENIKRDMPARGKSYEYEKRLNYFHRHCLYFINDRILAKDRMKLYQHSARCPVAMQIFLDANPQYWRFIPMTLEESEKPEQQIIQTPHFSDELNYNRRSKEDSLIYVESVPNPPTGYTFSNRQIVLQAQYFYEKKDQNVPNQDIDLYNATIVAVRK